MRWNHSNWRIKSSKGESVERVVWNYGGLVSTSKISILAWGIGHWDRGSDIPGRTQPFSFRNWSCFIRKSRTLKGCQPLSSLRSQFVENILDVKKVLPIFRSGIRPVRLLQAVSVQHTCLGMTCFQTALILFPFLSLSVMIDDNAHDFVKLLLPKAMSKSIILKWDVSSLLGHWAPTAWRAMYASQGKKSNLLSRQISISLRNVSAE
jgi:hypothetical protein